MHSDDKLSDRFNIYKFLISTINAETRLLFTFNYFQRLLFFGGGGGRMRFCFCLFRFIVIMPRRREYKSCPELTMLYNF